ncbi:MAG: stage II sporulation protein M [Eubacterium sp.]|nr:stage II sporulation protein M [Eubacterium sp.]
MGDRATKISGKRMSGLPWRGLLAGCFLLFFLIGILAANWVGQEKLLQYGMLNDYYVGQLAYAKLNMGEYFGYLLKRRMQVFGLAALFVYTRFGFVMLAGVIGWYAFSLGYLFVNALVSMKFQGMLLVLLSIFPQIIFYAASYFGLGKILFRKNIETAMPIGVQKTWKNPRLWILLSAVLCMAAGIWLEAYVNPMLLKSFIRRM